MYDIKWIRENPEAFETGLARRGMPVAERKALLGRIMGLDEERRSAIQRFEQMQARRNAASKEIGQAKKEKDDAKAAQLMAEVSELKESLAQLEADAKKYDDDLNGTGGLLATIPNTPLADVPDGADETGNVERHTFGKKRDYSFTPKQHFELGEALGMMDFELAAKLSGARFVVLQKGLARMERALGQFMLDLHTGEEHGYTEVNPPILVREEVMFGTAQLPKFRDDQFWTTITDVDPLARENVAEMLKAGLQFLVDYDEKLPEIKVEAEGSEKPTFKQVAPLLAQRIVEASKEHPEEYKLAIEEAFRLQHEAERKLGMIPTAEVPLTNLVRESIVAEDELPMRLTALTPCFRAEAGAAGKDTRGMIRQHQFTKVELVSITTPEKSRDEHERMLACAEDVLKKLGLHYRVMTLCTGDMGFAAQKTYDIEVWLPGQNMYREISSCSVCGDFQAQRMKARYKGKDGKVKGHVHTLNGSGVAVGRALIAVMETYQQADGSIAVPEALKAYMGGLTKVDRA